ncbi:hypothetical protein [Tsukamurella pseudospumae]|uniref:DUF2637 domain-containing protein n=1 Tax=Tsukamurella pseudospumae TaxID=239498 RepID=A0A138AU65_9ACTN|nr:hypothetical protein [Tsukamurella pseudospumae]KXP13926.1 hypothetical protein AXK60_22750 [Tsukamurella pseudospumae]
MSKNRTAGQPSPAYLRWTLAITMGLSTWLNVLHAASAHSPTAPYRIEMMVASAIPPLLVPALIELLGREARRGAASQRLFRSAYWTVVVLTLIAFAVSVWAISSLMISWGQPLIIAVAFPVVLDLAAGASTIFLLDRALSSQHDAHMSSVAADTDSRDTPSAVSPTPATTPDYPMLDPSSRWATVTTGDIPVITADTPEPVAVVQPTATSVAEPVSPAPVVTPPVALSPQVDDTADSDMSPQVDDTADSTPNDTDVDASTGDSNTAPVADTAPAPTPTPPADSAVSTSADIPHSDLDDARAVVAATGIKAGARDVAAVIAALGRGDALAVIARETGVHRTTVRKVRDHIAATAPAPARQLAAVS